MWKTIVRRILVLIPQLLVLSVLLFVLAANMPGDALTGLVDSEMDPLQIEKIREKHGLNDPMPVRYVRWIKNALKGDFGISMSYKLPVIEVIGDRIGNTLRLALLTLILSYLLAIPLGVISGRYSGSLADRTINTFTYFTMSVPTVVMGLVMMMIFVFILGWAPLGGSRAPGTAPGWETWKSMLYHMWLPAVSLAILSIVSSVSYLRTEIVDNKASDFATTAKSKGVPTSVIFNKHILRNSLIPMVSMIGGSISHLLGGSVLTERLFQYPGMGMLFVEAIERRDFSLVNAIVMIFAIMIVVGNLLADILLTIVDPRIRVR